MSRPRAWQAVTAGMLCVLLAACGSRIDPATYRAANGVVAGAAGNVGPAAGDIGAPGPGGQTRTTAGTGSDGITSSGGGTAGGSAGSGGAGAAAGTGAADASASSVKAGSCAGMKNQTGITDKKIVLANASDISGPVPGIFQSAQDAVRAFIAYFNARSSICGRKLQLMALDSRTDAGADQQAYAKACEGAFAAVGSMSAFDSGGARTAQDCGLPDIRSTSVNPARTRCTTCFATQAVTQNLVQNATPDYFFRNYHAASQKAAFLWINAGAAPVNAKSFVAGWRKRGFRVIYQQPIDVSEFNYSPYVEQMKSKGVRYVQYLGPYQDAVRLAQAMQQQGFKPDVFALDPTGYDRRYVETGGSAVEGTKVFLNITPFEEASSNAEMSLYLRWLQQVRPGSTPTFYGVFAWSAARLFVDEALALGGRLTRASLVARTRTVGSWTDDGMHSPQQVGSKRTGECWRFIRLHHGSWVPEGGTAYTCHGLSDTGVGG